jgi:hypothetical protein
MPCKDACTITHLRATTPADLVEVLKGLGAKELKLKRVDGYFEDSYTIEEPGRWVVWRIEEGNG